MTTPAPRQDVAVQLRRLLPAPVEQVFAAWTDPAALARWMGPGDEMETVVEQWELWPGGRWRWRLHDRGTGTQHVAAGRFLDIAPPYRLVLTWSWMENGMDVGESRVTVELAGRGDATEITLTHERLPGAAAREAHGEGWAGCLHCLERFLAGPSDSDEARL